MQRGHDAGWVSFGQNISVRLYFAPNVVGARKPKMWIFYMINPLLYETPAHVLIIEAKRHLLLKGQGQGMGL